MVFQRLCEVRLTFLGKIQVKSSLLLSSLERRRSFVYPSISAVVLIFTYATIQIRRPTNPPTPTHEPNQHGKHDTVLVYRQMRCGRVESRWGRVRARMLYVALLSLLPSYRLS